MVGYLGQGPGIIQGCCMSSIRKLHEGEVFLAARYRDAGIRTLGGIDDAAWLWHPQVAVDEPVSLLFENAFTALAGQNMLRLQVTADQHYELFLDGARISSGPDMGNVDHWFFSEYEVPLAPGAHCLQARVWWLEGLAPESAMTYRGGFVLHASGAYGEAVTTGRGPWRVCRLAGCNVGAGGMPNTYHVIGGRQVIDGSAGEQSGDWQVPAVVRAGINGGNEYGCCTTGWRLYPSWLPDQLERSCTPGRARAYTENRQGNEYRYSPEDQTGPQLSEWNRFLSGAASSLVIPAGSHITVLWDLEDYYSGFTEGEFSGGAGARVEWEWAESLYEQPLGAGGHKGDRGQIAGKYFHGFGHYYLASGSPVQHFRPYWWGAGRYCRLQITTGSEPLTVRSLRICEYRYPLRDEGAFCAGGAAGEGFDGIRKISVRALQMCAHTTYMDCPYYEQMMYVGDTRIEVLTTYMLTRDAALPRRAVELFDYSRSHWGVACERYPARCWQNSLTFAMIWTWMVHDYCFWRGDLNWVRERLAGVRANLDVIGQYADADGLLRDLPGWSFMDWVPAWTVGRAPGTIGGVSALINLMHLLSLRKTAELEDLAGEPLRAQVWRAKADALAPVILAKFWDEPRGLIADELTHASFSEHGQCLAILAGLFSPQQQGRVVENMLGSTDLHRTTIYFRYYYFDALCKAGRADVVLQGFEEWKELQKKGMMTTIEAPEPSRSDCHAWGTHPLFFMVAGLLGLRPVAPGMRRLRIAPQPAGLPAFSGKVPHPEGFVEFDLSFADGRCSGSIALPENTQGTFIWGGKQTDFTGTLWL